MKKLAKLTALLLTGVMLLLLASCGAAPNPGGGSVLTADEAKAKQEFIKAINEERRKAGKSSVREVQALTRLEQEFIEHFREAGTDGIPVSEAKQIEQELFDKQKKAGWQYTAGFKYYDGDMIAKLNKVYEGDTPEFRKKLKDWGLVDSISLDDPSAVLSMGVVTIEGKIYWSVSVLKPLT